MDVGLARVEHLPSVAHGALGLLLAWGVGTPKSESEALKWLKRAAAQGDALERKTVQVCNGSEQLLVIDKGRVDAWVINLTANKR
eukprot:2650636-Amphidinium_carterae.1